MEWFPFPPQIPGSLLALFGLQWWLTQTRLRDLPALPDVGPTPEDTSALPSVCLCIPARNEAVELGPALDSWLAQDYPRLRILLVDDDSTDDTAALAAQREEAHPGRLRVLRSHGLAPGWLGKNHALHLAASQPEAREADWLLFVDADVRATPDLLRRAVAHVHEQPADLLTLIAAVDAVGVAERIFIPVALMQFLWITPARRVANPHSNFFCGTGGFTLVRRKAYDAIGGHAAAPLEAIDDMRLAQRMKQAGFFNRVARGGPDLRLRMYHGGVEILRALRKNVLSMPYAWVLAPFMMVLLLALYFSPLWLAWGGWPLAGFMLWTLWPAMVGDAYQRLSARPMDWIWILWPLAGLLGTAGLAWAFVDRLRGVNHWRGRNVRLRQRPASGDL